MEESDEVSELTTDLVLDALGLPYLKEHFKSNGITPELLINLSPPQIPMLLPTPLFTIADQLKFTQQFVKIMTANKVVIHPAFLSELTNSVNDNHADSQKKVLLDTFLESGPSVSCSISVGKNTAMVNSSSELIECLSSDDCDDPTYHQPPDSNQSSESERGDQPPRKTLNATGVVNNNSQNEQHSEPKNSIENKGGMPKPLVDRSKLGSKRRNNARASSEVESLDLEQFFQSKPLLNGVLFAYRNSESKVLSDSDRSLMTKEIIQWMLNITEYPKNYQLEILAEKICQLFPSEEMSVYYIAPHTEGEKQTSAKGRLPMKVKNSKSWLRKKGVFEYSKKKSPLDLTSENDQEGNDSEMAAVEWLKRNAEPFEDVRFNWKVCRVYRLKALLQFKSLDPGQYIQQWFGLLQLPQGYKLILDDFDSLHEISDSYALFEGKGNNLMVHWRSVSQKIEQLIKTKDDIICFSELKDILAYLDNPLSDDTKDYILLQVLASICKPRSRVKVGIKVFKPSSKEAWDSFILHVTVAGNLLNEVKKRREHYQGMKATLQPFIIVVGASKGVVEAAYVCVNGALWKFGSVLQALDVCFKSFFCIQAEYPAEAYHLWLLVQRLLYCIELKGERSVANVTTLIKRLSVQMD